MGGERMRIPGFTLAIFIALGLMSCDRSDTARQEPPARQAGREAHQASRQIRQGVQEATHDLQHAGKQFRQGWNEDRNQTSPGNPSRPKQ